MNDVDDRDPGAVSGKDGGHVGDGVDDNDEGGEPVEELRPEQARALFQRALDEELTPRQQRALKAALARDSALDAELGALRRVMEATAKLSHNVPAVDLLSSVQSKLRTRSGGRFYRDRFAERRGRGALLPWAVAASVMVVLMTVLWFVLESGMLPH
jgi:hypothetical protein